MDILRYCGARNIGHHVRDIYPARQIISIETNQTIGVVIRLSRDAYFATAVRRDAVSSSFD